MKYTQREVQLNVESLTNKMELLKLQKTEITQNINSIKKQIMEWEQLNLSQTKLF